MIRFHDVDSLKTAPWARRQWFYIILSPHFLTSDVQPANSVSTKASKQDGVYIFIDTETTGAGPDDRLFQLAFKAGQGRGECRLFNPGKPIAIEAMAVHHITNEMVMAPGQRS